MNNPITSIHNWFRDLPDKKKYIEVITASLSIPVLLSVVLVNYLNIQEKRKLEPTPTPVISQPTQPTVITILKEPAETNSPTPPVSSGPMLITETPKECIKEIGPISIVSPKEGEQVNSNPFTINVDYEQGNYCSVVWRYRIDNGSWSQFNDKDIVIYNLPSGQKKLELEVKSIVANVSKTFSRSFTYTNTGQVETATPSPSSSSPSPTPTT